MEALDPRRTAVVVVDMVNWQVPRDVPDGAYWNQYFVDRCWETVVPAHQRLLPAARDAGASVVYLQLGGSEPDLSDIRADFRPTFQSFGAVIGEAACEVVPEIAPEADDVVLHKRGSGGYTTAALDDALRARGVDTVVYTGVLTHACVMLTATAGFDFEYSGYVARDATATFSDELQTATETALSAMAAQVTTTDEVIAALHAGVVSTAG